MASATEGDVHALQEQLQQLRTDFAAISGTLKDLARHGFNEAAQRATVPGERAWSEMRRHAATVSREIEEKPIASALTAFGVGLLLGLIVNSRR
jgi:ElaB/YqjD/DUF883 family membrane-anchored ribosome-binding protein